jgi:signal peptidase I
MSEEILLTKKGTVRKRKPKKANVYFTQETEDAIIEYLKLKSQKKRNQVFNEKINYAFHKLAENIIHTFKFYYTEVDTIPELQHEVVAFLLEKLHLYDQSKGKAFSYFGTIAKRYLILYNNANYKKLKDRAAVDEVDEDKSILVDLINNNNAYYDNSSTFMSQFIKYMDNRIYALFPKQKDARIADAVLELFRKSENIDIFNKKAFYIYIKEMTDATTPQITKIIKRLKLIYVRKYNEYYEHGHITMSN